MAIEPFDHLTRTKLTPDIGHPQVEPSVSSLPTSSNGGSLELQSTKNFARNGHPSPRLPWELFRNILDGLAIPRGTGQHCDPSLCVLARTCRSLQVEAERVIYRNIVFQSVTEQAWSINSVLQARAAEYVQKLSISNLGFGTAEMSPTDTRISSASSYALPFHRMTRLRSLTVWFLPFSRHGKAEEVKFFKKLNQTLIPNTLHQFWTLTVMPAQDIRFLRRQNQLRRLTTSKLPEDCIKDPSFLPQLEDLELKGDEIEQSLWLLQTRALRALSVTFRHAHLKQQFHGNSLVLLDMKFESVSQSSWISFLHLRAVDCPNVVCLFLQLDMGEDEEPLPAFDRAGNVDWFSPVIQALERWQQMQVLQLKAVTTTPPNHVVSAFKTNCRTPRLRDVLLQVSDEEDTEKNYELRRNVDRGWDVAESEQTDVLNWMNGSRSTVVQEPLVLTK